MYCTGDQFLARSTRASDENIGGKCRGPENIISQQASPRRDADEKRQFHGPLPSRAKKQRAPSFRRSPSNISQKSPESTKFPVDYRNCANLIAQYFSYMEIL